MHCHEKFVVLSTSSSGMFTSGSGSPVRLPSVKVGSLLAESSRMKTVSDLGE